MFVYNSNLHNIDTTFSAVHSSFAPCVATQSYSLSNLQRGLIVKNTSNKYDLNSVEIICWFGDNNVTSNIDCE